MSTRPEPPIATHRAHQSFWLLLGLALLFGAWIRCDQLAVQLPGDDEWHSLHALRDQDMSWIFTHFGASDHCIPTTLFEGLWMHVFGLDEIGLRFLPLTLGLASIVILPALARVHIGQKASILLAFLIAISPLHVYYSRFARPYVPLFLFAVMAVLCFERWWSIGGRRFAILFVASSVLAAWFHLAALPFVLAPFAWALFEHFARPRGVLMTRRRNLTQLVVLGLYVLIGLALLLGPPLWRDFETLRARSLGTSSGLPDPLVVFDRLRGTPRAIPAFIFALAALLGALALWRQQRRWFGFLLFAVACHVASICVLRPALLDIPLVMARYAMPALFVLSLATAVGLAEIDRLARQEWRVVPRHLPGALAILVLWRFGPLPSIHLRPNNWTNHGAHQGDYSPFAYSSFARIAMGVREVPPIYARLAKESAPEAVFLEAPWFYISERTPYTLFQRVHGHPIRVGFVAPTDEALPPGELPLTDGRFTFTNFVHVAEGRRLASRGIRYVIFHRQIPPAMNDTQGVDLRYVEQWIERYRTEVGTPLFEDADLCVFDLRS